MSEIKIQGLYKLFGPRPAQALRYAEEGLSKQALLEKHKHILGLRDVNIDIPGQQISVIMGLSGSGKSTLIRHINRLIEPTAGSVLVDGQDILSMRDKDLRQFRRFTASMVFQKFGLHVHKTVLENIGYGLSIQGLKSSIIEDRSRKWLDRVGLSGFENHYPAQLSGGMQQRVGLARALATDADILLMDEAFSALDPLIRSEMQLILLSLQRELHKTIVFITHDLDEALRIGDSITILRDGEVIQQGDPQQIILQPKDDYIIDFVNDINRGRVLKTRSLMTPGAALEGPSISAETVLESALPILLESQSHRANVVDELGETIGTLSLEQAISALSSAAANPAADYR